MTDSSQIYNWLNNLSSESAFFRKKTSPSLSTFNRALDGLGRPDNSFKYRIIIGGSAGKGTVCRYLEAGILELGTQVTLVSSPHLQTVHERIRHNGKLIADDQLKDALSDVKKLMSDNKLSLTYYEVMVLAGIISAVKNKSEILVCEVGLGGEFDAVNAVQGPRLCGLTFIGDDHLEILGPERENIAETKSKIFTQESIYNISYEQEFRSIFNKNSSIKIEYIKGVNQKLNKKLARNIVEQIYSSKIDFMPPIKLPCRWEKIDNKIILDGAHSSARFEFLEATKLKKFKGPYTMILGMQKRHNFESFQSILPYAKKVIWTKSGGENSHSPSKLRKHFDTGICINDPKTALEMARALGEPILVSGSFYLCGEIRETFYPSSEIINQQTEWPELEQTRL